MFPGFSSSLGLNGVGISLMSLLGTFWVHGVKGSCIFGASGFPALAPSDSVGGHLELDF